MSKCLNHKKELFGETDMKKVAEAIGDLNYKTLYTLLKHLSQKISSDSYKDKDAGRTKLADALLETSKRIDMAHYYTYAAYEISKSYMK